MSGFAQGCLTSWIWGLGSLFLSGFGFRISVFDLGFKGAGFRISDFGFHDLDFRFRDLCFRFYVSVFVFRVLGFGFWILGFGFCVSGLRFCVSGFRVRASGFESEVYPGNHRRDVLIAFGMLEQGNHLLTCVWGLGVNASISFGSTTSQDEFRGVRGSCRSIFWGSCQSK